MNRDTTCQLLLYLDRKRFLHEIKKDCKTFLDELTEESVRKFPPFRYTLEIDVMDLLDSSPDLGIFLIKEPISLKNMCSEIIFACIQTLDSSSGIMESQVAADLRVKCVPPHLVPTNPRHYSGLVSFCGQLVSASAPASYVLHAVWSCPEECEGNELILRYIPKVLPKCCVCRSILFENRGFRRCGEQVTATLKIKTDLLPRKFAIVDDQIAKLKVGSKYIIYAVAVKKVVVVLSVEEMVMLCAPVTTPAPRLVDEVLRAGGESPARIVYYLASGIGANVCPFNCFMPLKISLLLSLASVKANQLTGASIVHVLAAGNEPGLVCRLMGEAAALADTSLCLGASNTTVSTALIASAGGVCVMPLPLHAYSQKRISAILSCIETGDVTTETEKVKLRSAVWAQGTDLKKMSVMNVTNVFGSACRGDRGEDDDEVAEFVLCRAMAPTKTSDKQKQALNDGAQYLELVAGMQVSMDENAETLLGKYFVGARREGARGVAVGTMGALAATCLASARVRRRRVATAADAALAAWLHAAGARGARFVPAEYLHAPPSAREFQKLMNQFKDWLQQITLCNIEP